MELRLYRAFVRAFQPSELTRQRKASGLCLSCGAKPAEPGHLACLACAAKIIAYH
jgi:hypothetical protein